MRARDTKLSCELTSAIVKWWRIRPFSCGELTPHLWPRGGAMVVSLTTLANLQSPLAIIDAERLGCRLPGTVLLDR